MNSPEPDRGHCDPGEVKTNNHQPYNTIYKKKSFRSDDNNNIIYNRPFPRWVRVGDPAARGCCCRPGCGVRCGKTVSRRKMKKFGQDTGGGGCYIATVLRDHVTAGFRVKPVSEMRLLALTDAYERPILFSAC
jgi:hypothetical protein